MRAKLSKYLKLKKFNQRKIKYYRLKRLHKLTIMNPFQNRR